MATLAELQNLRGKDEGEQLFKYLGNKNKGGINNAKGASFENFFAVFKIAQLADKNVHDSTTHLSAQTPEFVDDLIIESANPPTAHHFQIKDVTALAWDAGNHTIENDFVIQIALCQARGVAVRCTLVVSRKDVHDGLDANMPANISASSGVLHFQGAKTINSLLQVNQDFKDAITSICALSQPSSDALVSVASIILGAWDASAKNKETIADLMGRCRDMNAAFIKGLAGQLLPAVEQLLNAIPGFSFRVENAFLVWEYGNTDSGKFLHPIGVPQFAEWERTLSNAAAGIASFEDLEPYLLS